MSAPTAYTGEAFQRLPLTALQPYNKQARKEFDPDEMQSLADSIFVRGVIQPIVVKPLAEEGRFEILAGERRWRASQAAGLTHIPAIVRADLSAQDAEVLHLVENLQRKDLSLAEVCEGVRELVRDVGIAKAAQELGKSEAWISKRAGVLDLPTPIQNLVAEGVVNDLEIVGTLAQIQDVDPSQAARIIKTIVSPADWERPVTRESVRQDLKHAQRRQKEKLQEVQDEAKREAEAAKAAGEADKAAAKAKERERQIARVKEGRKKLKDAALASMTASLAFTSKQMQHFLAPIRLDYSSADFANAYSPKETFPATPEACNYDFRGNGDVATLSRITAGFSKKPKIAVRVPELSLEQAGRLEEALKDVKGLQMWFDAKVSGKELNAISARLAGSPIPAGGAAKAKSGADSPEKQGELCINTFLAERVDRNDKSAKVKAADVHAAYVTWCKKAKLDLIAFNDNRWGAAIAAAGIKKHRHKTGYQYLGCSLK